MMLQFWLNSCTALPHPLAQPPLLPLVVLPLLLVALLRCQLQ